MPRSGQTRHDTQNGQVYTETLYPAIDIGEKWAKQTKGSKKLLQLTRELRLPSLYILALQSILLNSDDLTAALLLSLPNHLVKAIWKALERNQLISLHVWKTFATAFPHWKRVSNRRQPMRELQRAPLSAFLDQIASPDLLWMTVLNLANIDIPRVELIKLADLPNLAVFQIEDEDRDGPDIDERLLRAWGEAGEAGGFPNLTAMSLRVPQGRFYRPLDQLARLPALQILCLTINRYLKLDHGVEYNEVTTDGSRYWVHYRIKDDPAGVDAHDWPMGFLTRLAWTDAHAAAGLYRDILTHNSTSTVEEEEGPVTQPPLVEFTVGKHKYYSQHGWRDGHGYVRRASSTAAGAGRVATTLPQRPVAAQEGRKRELACVGEEDFPGRRLVRMRRGKVKDVAATLQEFQ